jgi:hypothetical protein
MSLEMVIFLPSIVTMRGLRDRLGGDFQVIPDTDSEEPDTLTVLDSDDRNVCRIDIASPEFLNVLVAEGIERSKFKPFFLHYCRWPKVNDVVLKLAGSEGGWIYPTTETLISSSEYASRVRADPSWSPYR